MTSCLAILLSMLSGIFTVAEWNCENVFDTLHCEGKNDVEFTPEGTYHWNSYRYWHKLNQMGRAIASMDLPDLVMLCEVENDSVLFDLTHRSLLRTARYDYIITNGLDERGINVALLYSPASFRPIQQQSISIPTLPGMRPTRDILYVSGEIISGDTLHVMVVHAPSRRGGEATTRHYRQQVAEQVCMLADSIRQHQSHALVLIAGDFNDYGKAPALQTYARHQLKDLSEKAKGSNGAIGTYRYQGEWNHLDHIFVSPSLAKRSKSCLIHDPSFLLIPDETYSGQKPHRTYLGPRYQGGFSDHLPLIAHFEL